MKRSITLKIVRRSISAQLRGYFTILERVVTSSRPRKYLQTRLKWSRLREENKAHYYH